MAMTGQSMRSSSLRREAVAVVVPHMLSRTAPALLMILSVATSRLRKARAMLYIMGGDRERFR
jgi:hypothetical protein